MSKAKRNRNIRKLALELAPTDPFKRAAKSIARRLRKDASKNYDTKRTTER